MIYMTIIYGRHIAKYTHKVTLTMVHIEVFSKLCRHLNGLPNPRQNCDIMNPTDLPFQHIFVIIYHIRIRIHIWDIDRATMALA